MKSRKTRITMCLSPDLGCGMTQTFFIPGPLPGMNDYISTGNRFRYNIHKKQWSKAIAASIKSAKLKPMLSARFHFVWMESHNRRDPDNFTSLGKKWILDALVTCSILPNDGWANIKGWSDGWMVDKDRPGVLVVLEDPV